LPDQDRCRACRQGSCPASRRRSARPQRRAGSASRSLGWETGKLRLTRGNPTDAKSSLPLRNRLSDRQLRLRRPSNDPAAATPNSASARAESTLSARCRQRPWSSQLGGDPPIAGGRPTRPVGQIAVVGGTRRLRQDRPFRKQPPNASVCPETDLREELTRTMRFESFRARPAR
jgi:hypothetical protein